MNQGSLQSPPNQAVTMIRHHLDGIPQHALPPGYSFRWYQDGDREAWVRVQERSERYVSISPQLYDTEFGHNERELSRRQAFLLDAQRREIGTATAWFNDNYHGRPFGRVHWVAIVPEHQGRGLAKPLLTTVCNRLIELGHDCAYLCTHTVRRAAISLYLSYGFEPEIGNDEERKAWDHVLEILRQPKRR